MDLYEPHNAGLAITALLDVILRYCASSVEEEPPEGRSRFNAARTFIRLRPTVPMSSVPTRSQQPSAKHGNSEQTSCEKKT